jgi:Fic family protein
MYLHEQINWTNFYWEENRIGPLLARVRFQQGYLLGRIQSLGFDLQVDAELEALALDAVKSSEIEGERLDHDQVRSSLARRLGLPTAGLPASSRRVDAVVELLLDASKNYLLPLTDARLFGWQAALFPTGFSGPYPVCTGAYRTDAEGPMQVVSGPLGRQKVHFQAPAASRLAAEMPLFLDWLNAEASIDPVLKAGVAHLWFLTLHPFEDGNGRLARALTDLLLARADGQSQRFYSLSAQICSERNAYYDALESAQKGDADITEWLVWFLLCLQQALQNSVEVLDKVLQAHQFWQQWQGHAFSEGQLKVIRKLLAGFEGHLTTSKWAKINGCSTDTALRDITDLLQRGILAKAPSGSRSTHYLLQFVAQLGC